MKTRKRIKRVLTLAAALAMAALLSACGKGADASPVHDYTYTTPAGNEFSGTYTGGWEGGQPNGEGSFSSKGEKGEISLDGTWANGQPNGQCRYIFKDDTYIGTFSGDFFYGEMKGNIDYKIEDLEGNLMITYSGEFRDGDCNGNGEKTDYYNAESGIDRVKYKGTFSDGNLDGEGEMTVYYTAGGAGQYGVNSWVYKGQFSDGNLAGEGTMIYYFTSEYAEAHGGVDCEILTGQYRDGGFVEPYRYAFWKGNEVLEEGRVRNGEYVSNTEKAFKDSIYDGLRDMAGDGITGYLFDILAPEFYDRNAE